MWYPDIRLTRTFRLAFMITLIATFFIVSPIIILYTAGYRYDFNIFQVRKTGVITIDAEPTDAQVFLNDVALDTSIPIRLTNRAPGSYDVRIERDGFLPWQKNVHVESTQTSYVTDIYLFLDVLATFEHALEGGASSYSPDGSYIVTMRQQDEETPVYEISLYDLASEIETLVWRGGADAAPDIIWSRHAPRFAIVSLQEGPPSIETIDAQNTETTHTYELQSTARPTVQWHEDGDDVLYVQEQEDILALSDGETEVLSSVSSSRWFVDSNADVWNLTDTNELWKDGSLLLPNVANAQIDTILDSRATHLLARGENEAHIVWLDSGEVTSISSTDLFPRTYGKNWSTWIIWSEWEVLELIESGDVTLLTRTNEPLRDVEASTKHETLFFAFDKRITAYHPHYRTTHPLFNGDAPITKIAAHEDGDYLLFETSINDNEGSYKRAL